MQTNSLEEPFVHKRVNTARVLRSDAHIWAKTAQPLHGAGSWCNPCTENMCIFVLYQSSDRSLWSVIIVIQDIWMMLTVAKSVRSIRTHCARSMRVQDPKERTQNALVCTEFNIIYIWCKWPLETQISETSTNHWILSASFQVSKPHTSYTARVDKANKLRDGKQSQNIAYPN